jgi:hypothetical protein
MKAPNISLEAPITKLQAPEKLQSPRFNIEIFVTGELGLGVWDLSGAWSLGFGAF